MNRFKLSIVFNFTLLACIMYLTSCDALLTMSYKVNNKTNETIKLKIYNYPLDNVGFANVSDTIVDIVPGQTIKVANSRGIGFPWETKKLYKKNRGVDNFKLVLNDSLISIDLNDKYWNYKNQGSIYTIKELPDTYFNQLISNKFWYTIYDSLIKPFEVRGINFSTSKIDTLNNQCYWHFDKNNKFSIGLMGKNDAVFLPQKENWLVKEKILCIGEFKFELLKLTEKELTIRKIR